MAIVKYLKRIFYGNSSFAPKVLMGIMLIVFMAHSIFLSLNLRKGIIPDENAHLAFSIHYSSTYNIPEDSPETSIYGWYIEQNPFLYYWINGRAINLLNVFLPSASEWQVLVFLRLISVTYAAATVIFCYFLSREVIHHKWWQLFPSFLLTNTLMFVFLSGGVNYDNLANLFSMAGLLFWVRVINKKDFIFNSIGWMSCICLGSLVKFPILPLALAMGITWLIFTITQWKKLIPLEIKGAVKISSGLILVGLISANLAIYGVNLIKYQSITPGCIEILPKEQCEISPYVKRFDEIGLDQPLTILESIQLGYPNPIDYAIDWWMPNMLSRIFGILAHLDYNPSHIITFFRILFYWTLLLIFRYWKNPPFSIYGLLGIFLFYSLVLFINNINSELAYGYHHIAIQGRYIFPVIGAAYVILGYFLSGVPNKYIRITTLLYTLVLFLAGGPIKFILKYNTIFEGWFIVR